MQFLCLNLVVAGEQQPQLLATPDAFESKLTYLNIILKYKIVMMLN